jgi:hypothetical protein
MKIISTIPVKNDAWFIEKSIRSLAVWSDHVFVADESSDDGSHEVYDQLSNLPNVTIIRNRPKVSFETPDLRNYLLNVARSFDGNNLIFEFHADEVMSAEILNERNRNMLLERATPGNAFMFPWLTLWGSPTLIRADKSVWADNKCWFGYCDDRKVKFDGPVFHGPRAPESFLRNKIYLDNLAVLHYQFVNKSNELSKQALYQIYEKNHHPNKSVEHINKIYSIAFDTKNINLKKIDGCHINPWINAGIELMDEYTDKTLNYRDKEVLRNFKKNGSDFYKNLNIWYIDWESKRQEAIKLGVEEIPNYIIIDTRNGSTKLAHWWVTKTQFYAFWRLDFLKLLLYKGPKKLLRYIKLA